MDREQAELLLEEAQRSDRLAVSPLARQLAVLGTFHPARLERGKQGEDVMRLLCKVLPSRDGRPEAIMSESRRVDALASVLEEGGRDALVRVREMARPDFDTPLQRMLDAFVFDRELEAPDEDELLAGLEVWRWATDAVARARLTGKVRIEPGRDEIESRLALLEVTRAVRKLAGDGQFVGRRAERDRLHEYRRQARPGHGLADEPAMVVYGIGGVGKSTLVARFVMDLYEKDVLNEPEVWAYLDLDRPTLSSCEPLVLLDDIIRQVATQSVEHRRMLERHALVGRARVKGAGLEAMDDAGSYRWQASEFADSIRSIGRGSLTVVLDTFEELDRSRPELEQDIYGLFAALASELPQFRLIVSGRCPAALFVSEQRPDRQLHVEPLKDEEATALLCFFADREALAADGVDSFVDEDLAREIVRQVGGIPLTLRLAAKVLVNEGATGVLDAAKRAYALDRVRQEFVRGFLYQRILDHLVARDPGTTEALRQVARASLVLRRITVALVERVLLPATALEDPPSATALFEMLASEVAFTERDGNVLRLREELRGPALAALTLAEPQLVRRVHELAAAVYLDTQGEELSAIELAYHRLATGHEATTLDHDTMRKLEPSLADLPASSADVIRETLRDPSLLTPSRDLAEWERGVLAEADSALRSGQLDVAEKLLAQRVERSAGSELHRLESRLHEARGDLKAAEAASRRDLEASAVAGDSVRNAAAAVRLAGLFERDGEPDSAADTLREVAEAPLLSGYAELRLELVLNRMNTLERARLDTDELRWSLGLDARALIQRSDPPSIATNTALTRLLAAALGREEPERIREAVRLVGLGYDEDPRRVRALVTALSAWDIEQQDPGRLARSANLRVDADAPDGIERAWSAVSGLGIDAGLLLDRLWRAELPPEPVREALRLIYVWWGFASTPDREDEADPLSVLQESPIDWSRIEAREFEEILLTAYPTSSDNRALADAAGLDLSEISWSGSNRRITRDLLGIASRSGRVDALVRTMLYDKSAASVHPRLRGLVGDAWLDSHDLLM